MFRCISPNVWNVIYEEKAVPKNIANLTGANLWQSLIYKFANLYTPTQPAITCSKLTTETLDQGVKYAQS